MVSFAPTSVITLLTALHAVHFQKSLLSYQKTSLPLRNLTKGNRKLYSVLSDLYKHQDRAALIKAVDDNPRNVQSQSALHKFLLDNPNPTSDELDSIIERYESTSGIFSTSPDANNTFLQDQASFDLYSKGFSSQSVSTPVPRLRSR